MGRWFRRWNTGHEDLSSDPQHPIDAGWAHLELQSMGWGDGIPEQADQVDLSYQWVLDLIVRHLNVEGGECVRETPDVSVNLLHTHTRVHSYEHTYPQPCTTKTSTKNKAKQTRNETSFNTLEPRRLKKSKSTNFGEKWRKRTLIYCWWDFKMVHEHCQFFKNQT